jgi:16S rRNA (cytidine1402-2'-O)-methyltransferase
VCRELTKTYEEVVRGTLGTLAERVGEPRGEITLVVGGAVPAVERPDDGQLAAEVAGHEAGGTPRKEAIALVALEYGLPKRDVYQAVLATR